MVRSNIGRALYIVYSFLMIPVLTILLSLLGERVFKTTKYGLGSRDFRCLKLCPIRQQKKEQESFEERSLELTVLMELNEMLEKMTLWFKKHRHIDVEQLESFHVLKSKLEQTVQDAAKRVEGDPDEVK